MARSMPADGAGGHSNLVFVGTAEARWGPLAILAAYAALDFLLQYSAPAVAVQEVVHVPQSLLDFLQVNTSACMSYGQHVFSPDDHQSLFGPCEVEACVHESPKSRAIPRGCVSWLRLPLWLQDVVGIDADAAGWSLVLRLLRPMALLALLHILRFGFALGTLEVNV